MRERDARLKIYKLDKRIRFFFIYIFLFSSFYQNREQRQMERDIITRGWILRKRKLNNSWMSFEKSRTNASQDRHWDFHIFIFSLTDSVPFAISKGLNVMELEREKRRKKRWNWERKWWGKKNLRLFFLFEKREFAMRRNCQFFLFNARHWKFTGKREKEMNFFNDEEIVFDSSSDTRKKKNKKIFLVIFRLVNNEQGSGFLTGEMI